MRFWDSSAIVPLLTEQPATPRMQGLAAAESGMLVWWSTAVECASAVTRVTREGFLDDAATATAFERLRLISAGWSEIEPSTPIRQIAIRLLRVHPLKAADALQLAAAVAIAGDDPSAVEIVTLDTQLARAAHKEGFVLTEV